MPGQMRSLQRLRLLFMVVLCCILISALESFPSDHDEYEESKNGVKRAREDVVASIGAGAGAGARGVGGGESGGREENGNNNNNNNGGGGVIPVYGTAGAANKHRNNGHHSAGSSQVLFPGFTLTSIFMAYLISQAYSNTH